MAGSSGTKCFHVVFEGNTYRGVERLNDNHSSGRRL